MTSKSPLEIILEHYYVFMDEQKAQGLGIPTLEEFMALNPQYGMAFINTLVSDFKEDIKKAKPVNQQQLQAKTVHFNAFRSTASHNEDVFQLNKLLFISAEVQSTDHKRSVEEQAFRIVVDRGHNISFLTEVVYPEIFIKKLADAGIFCSKSIEVTSRFSNGLVFGQVLKFSDVFDASIFFEYFKFELGWQELQVQIEEYSGKEIRSIRSNNWHLTLKSEIVNILNNNIR